MLRDFPHLLLLSGDVSLNPEPVQKSSSKNSTICESLNKKGLHSADVNLNSLLSKRDEIRYIANKTKAAIIGIKEPKLYYTLPASELSLPGEDGFNSRKIF